MSKLYEMNQRLKRLRQATIELKAAITAFREAFRSGDQVEFDRGDMRLVCGVVLTTDDSVAIVQAVPKDIGPWLRRPNENGSLVHVPWALLFTPEAAKEMHAVRDHLLQDDTTGADPA